MSAGLMSCVRENSPPLDMAGSQIESESGALSLPVSAVGSANAPTITTPIEQQKRRRFHPLRNLRRIFRRRTLTSSDAPSTRNQQQNILPTSTPQHTGNPTTLQILSEKTIPNLTLSSPSSPSSHYNLLVKSPTNLSTVPAHLIKSDVTMMTSSYLPSHLNTQHNVNNSNTNNSINNNNGNISTTLLDYSSNNLVCGRKSPSGGIQVIPQFSCNNNNNNMNTAAANYYLMMKNKSDKNDNNNDDDDDEDDDGIDTNEDNSNNNNRDLFSDSQRSFSEGRLVDGNGEALSQSRDSVFSESATASSLSIVLKNELFDVLRKRNRPDASEEDLGLPHSPRTPQRNENGNQNTTNQQHNNLQQSEVSSLSLLSMGSSDLDDDLSSPHQQGDSSIYDKTTISTSSSKISTSIDTSRASDEIDLSHSSTLSGRLSHSAAKHKMAVRPIKKKGPTRHRRPIETTVLPSTPEVNEDLIKIALLDAKDFNAEKAKSRSLPPGVNPKTMDQHNVKNPSTNIKRSKTEKGSSPTSTYSIHNITKSSTCEKDLNSTSDKIDDDYGFFKRFLHRNSKKNNKKAYSRDDLDHSGIEATTKIIINEHSQEYSQRVEETRKEIRREILSEANSGLSLMLNNFILSTPEPESESKTSGSKVTKLKSGAASRQRVMPKDLSNSNAEYSSDKNSSNEFLEIERSRSSDSSECSNSIGGKKAIIKISNECLSSSPNKIEITKLPLKSSNEEIQKSVNEEIFKSHLLIKDFEGNHFEKQKPRIVGLSPFQQKITRAEIIEGGVPPPILPKGRKSVEKSRSFRFDGTQDTNLKKYDNMPSLPDLTLKSSLEMLHVKEEEEQSVSLGFEINDNNLMNLKHEEHLPLSHGIFTKNIILTTSKPNKLNNNITEIEDNIDKLLISQPLISAAIMKKSTSIEEVLENKGIIEKKRIEVPDLKLNNRKGVILKTNFEQNNLGVNKNLDFSERKSMIEISKSCDSVVEIRNKGSADMRPMSNPIKARRSSSISEKSSDDNKVPEFMKIQLNRVADPTRPKSNVVLSKNIKDLEINPPKMERSKTNLKEDTNRNSSSDNVENSDSKPPLPPIPLEYKRNSLVITNQEGKSQCKKSDVENKQEIFSDRRKSVTDEKLKYEKKIEELIKPEITKSERKKSTDSLDSRKQSIEDDTVVLRRRSATSTNKDDPTPELMKVFARRSLKVKDDELQTFSDVTTTENTQYLNQKKFGGNVDSDKENQSSSEEKLNKLSKSETSIQTQNNIKQKQTQSVANKPQHFIYQPSKSHSTSLNNQNQTTSLTNKPHSKSAYSSDELLQKSRSPITDQQPKSQSPKLNTSYSNEELLQNSRNSLTDQSNKTTQINLLKIQSVNLNEQTKRQPNKIQNVTNSNQNQTNKSPSPFSSDELLHKSRNSLSDSSNKTHLIKSQTNKSQLETSKNLKIQQHPSPYASDELLQKAKSPTADIRNGNVNGNARNNNNINNNSSNSKNSINSIANKQQFNRYSTNVVTYKSTTPERTNNFTGGTNKLYAVTENSNGNCEENNNFSNLISQKTMRHTIGVSAQNTDQVDEQDNEFKGIFQRRAEWEKRAKEALK